MEAVYVFIGLAILVVALAVIFKIDISDLFDNWDDFDN
jgi:hypothetical protein